MKRSFIIEDGEGFRDSETRASGDVKVCRYCGQKTGGKFCRYARSRLHMRSKSLADPPLIKGGNLCDLLRGMLIVNRLSDPHQVMHPVEDSIDIVREHETP
ncbi:hypothetical protein [Haematobacter missouriensis]|uniref:hypothetical protein n=1 Tax=Haematobacter missouriensis TaxID=366616 RepID=UPI00117A817A|nr:hypothetical protein [Haematobacter missouriensis]